MVPWRTAVDIGGCHGRVVPFECPRNTIGAIGPSGATGVAGATGLGLAIDSFDDTAGGTDALRALSVSTESDNTAFGFDSLFSSTDGAYNTAVGSTALLSDVSDIGVTAIGYGALYTSNGGNESTAVGYNALGNVATGGEDIALGANAGSAYTTNETNNISIGNMGSPAESGVTRIGAEGTQDSAYIAGIYGVTVSGSPVVVNSNGQLGVAPSSRRFKEDIKDMGSASEAILALRPVTFRYKPEVDPAGSPQFGLVAEEVEKVSPDLVVHDANHQIYTVRYDAVNAMLLNEFRKQHEVVQQQKEIEALRAQLSQVDALTARLDALERTAADK